MKSVLNLTDTTGRLARWRLRLPRFSFDVIHRTEVKHQTANVFSRLLATGNGNTPLEDDLLLLAIIPKGDGTNILVIGANRGKIIPLNAQSENSIDTHPTVERLNVDQACEDYCKATTLNVCQSRSELSIH